MHAPTNLQLIGSEVAIVWDDGAESYVTFEKLRAASPSAANIGGAASAPVVAEVYHPGLASVGLLLAILGNIVGTWLGIVCAQLCRML